MPSLRFLFGADAEILYETNFQLLLLSTTLPILGTLLVSPMLDSLIKPFETTPKDIGLMISFLTAPGIVMIPIAGMIADRIGRKPVLLTSILLFGLAGSMIALTTDFRVVLGLRFLQGIGFAGITPILITSIRDQYSGTREATAHGLRLSLGGISGAIFPLLSGFLVVIAWQYPFLLYLIALPIAALVFLRYDDPTVGKKTSRDSLDAGYARSLFDLIRRPRVLTLIIARSLPNVVWIGFYTYNSLIVIRLIGGTPLLAGLLAAVGNLVFAVAASQAGRVTNIFGTRVIPIVSANVLLGAGFGVLLYAPDILYALAGITLMGAGTGILLSLYRSLITGLAPQSLRSGLVGIAESMGRVANTLTPIAMGAIIATTSQTLGFAGAIRVTGVAMTVFATGGGIVCILLASAAPRTPAEPEIHGND